jgi:polysaccharide deacetylase family protein (PEP-CTERM system associated)
MEITCSIGDYGYKKISISIRLKLLNDMNNSVNGNRKTNIINAITVDVEDYYQVSAFSKQIDKQKWDEFPSRVNHNTRRILKIFDDKKINSTFFVLGWIAERYPELIKEISDCGHEIASHGYSHDLIYDQTPNVFRDEAKRSKDLLEDIINKTVLGYRAASYSITRESIWAIDILIELGFKYDSSIFPIIHDRYGIPGGETAPHILRTNKGKSIIEFPLSTVGTKKIRLPISGGGYFRLFPYWISKKGLNRINSHESIPFIFYMHPWEIDKDQPRIKSKMISEFRHYNNIKKFEDRLIKLLDDFKFDTVSAVLTDSGLLQ